jgi:hypothetical protein
MKSQLIVPVSPDPVTGSPRQAQLEAFQILADLNMVFKVRVQQLSPDGRLKSDTIREDTNLSDYQRDVALEQFVDRVVPRQTGGSFVDPATGQLVAGDTAGAISQRDYFQAITLGQLKAQGLSITDQTTLAELIYAMLTAEILKSDFRKEI